MPLPRILLSLLTLFLFATSTACLRHEIVINEESEATLVIPVKLHFKLKPTATISFPANYPIPALAGLTLGAGSCFEFDVDPGEIKFKDKISATGTSAPSSDTNGDPQQTLNHRAVNPGVAVPIPAPKGTITYIGTVNSGSTYTWILPELFGEKNEAEVQVTGDVTAVAYDNAMTLDPATGTYTLRSGGLKSFSYKVTGPAAVWQLPMTTPWGVIPGPGTLESSDTMVYESTQDLDSIKGVGFEDYTDDQGYTWDYGFIGGFPVRLTVGGDTGIGATTVEGGVDLYPL